MKSPSEIISEGLLCHFDGGEITHADRQRLVTVLLWHADDTDWLLRKRRFTLILPAFFVISRNEKSPRETRQRLAILGAEFLVEISPPSK